MKPETLNRITGDRRMHRAAHQSNRAARAYRKSDYGYLRRLAPICARSSLLLMEIRAL